MPFWTLLTISDIVLLRISAASSIEELAFENCFLSIGLVHLNAQQRRNLQVRIHCKNRRPRTTVQPLVRPVSLPDGPPRVRHSASRRRPLILHHSSHTTHLTPLISHCSSHPLISHNSSQQLISHNSSHPTHLTAHHNNSSHTTRDNNSSHATHHTQFITTTHLTRLITFHSSYVQISWQAQCLSADFVAGAALGEPGVQISWQAQYTEP